MEKHKSALKNLRMEKGITAEQLARNTGVAVRTIVQMESEDGANPQLSTIKRLLMYLKITFEDLYPN